MWLLNSIVIPLLLFTVIIEGLPNRKIGWELQDKTLPPPPPPVPEKHKPYQGSPPPLPPQLLDLLPEEEEDIEESMEDGSDEGLYNQGLLEGDIKPSKRDHRNAVTDKDQKWPYGAIVYKTHESVGCPSSPQCGILMKAMAIFHKITCVRFKEWSGEDSALNIFINQNSGACWSSVGRTGEAEQELSLGERCWYLGLVIHELFHAVGFWHEMNRPDRDDWIWVYWQNIIPGYQGAFTKSTLDTVNELGEKFDYQSIMMYDEYAFSKDGVSATLQAKEPGTVIGPIWKKKSLSQRDLRRLEKLYSCQGNQPLPGFPYDIHCDFNQNQCGFHNGGSSVWNWQSVSPTDGYLYASWENTMSDTGYLQSINFHPRSNDLNSSGRMGCLRFWYYIDGDHTAQLLVLHAYLDRVTQLFYQPHNVFELWEDHNVTNTWTHVDIPLYITNPFKLDKVESKEVEDSQPSTKGKLAPKGKKVGMGTKGKGMAIETMASPIGRRVQPRIDPQLIKKVERAMMVKENKGKRTKVKKELPEEKDEFDAMADGKTPTLAQRVGNSPDAVENRLKAKKAHW